MKSKSFTRTTSSAGRQSGAGAANRGLKVESISLLNLASTLSCLVVDDFNGSVKMLSRIHFIDAGCVLAIILIKPRCLDRSFCFHYWEEL